MIVSANSTSEDNPPERLGSWARTETAQLNMPLWWNR